MLLVVVGVGFAKYCRYKEGRNEGRKVSLEE
jgi:hypothetical protein